MPIKPKKLFILQSFVSNAVIIYPLYAIMFTERGGLSVGDVSILFAIWTAAAAIFELPTGLIADRYSRKHLLIGGELVNTGAFLVWLVAPSFLGYAIGFVMWGLAYALKSGAYQALIYDELAANGQQQKYIKMMSHIRGSEFAGMLLAFISAYLLSIDGVNYQLLLIISMVTGIASAGLLALLPNVQKLHTDIPAAHLKLLKHAFQVVVHNSRIRIVILWLAVVAGFIGWYEEYTPLFDKTAGIPTKYIPLVISGALVLNIIASLLAPRLEAGGKKINALLLLGAGTAVILATLGWWLPLIIFLAHGGLVLLRILRILLDSELQHAADNKVRATLGSVAGLLSYPVTIGVALTFALLSEHVRMEGFLPFRWVGIAILICAVWLISYKAAKKSS